MYRRGPQDSVQLSLSGSTMVYGRYNELVLTGLKKQQTQLGAPVGSNHFMEHSENIMEILDTLW